MDIEIGKGKTARRAYGLDEIAIVPSRRTRDPEDVDISWSLGDLHLDLPCLASALDAAVDPTTAGIIGNLGGLAVLNLEGLQTRYEDPDPVFEEIASLPPHKATRVMQDIYAEPIKEELVFRRVQEIKDKGVIAAASLTPQRVEKYHRAAIEAGLDVLVIQGTVVSAEHVSSTVEPLNLMEFGRRVGHGGRLRDPDAYDAARRADPTRPHTDQHANGAGPHQVQRRRVAGAPADHDGNVERGHELHQVERLYGLGDMLGGDDGPLYHEHIQARLYRGPMIFLHPLGGQGGGGDNALVLYLLHTPEY